KLSTANIKTILPDECQLNEIESIIRKVIAGKADSTMANKLNAIARDLRSRGAQRVIVGCTELSVALKDSRSKHFVDPLDLAANCVTLANEQTQKKLNRDSAQIAD
ncbi:MAG: aspartate/glutamate racemase family protein, partial [Candidatus Saccharimonadales bacterium]